MGKRDNMARMWAEGRMQETMGTNVAVFWVKNMDVVSCTCIA